MLRTIPFPADHVDEEGAFGRRAIAFRHQRGDRGGIVGKFDDRRMADKLQPVAVRVIHQEERDAVVAHQVRGADILFVAAIVGETDAIARDMAEEARGPAAMLHIGPAVGGDARDIEAVAERDIAQFLGGQRIGGAVGARVHLHIGGARAMAFLQRLHRVVEKRVSVISRHRSLPSETI